MRKNNDSSVLLRLVKQACEEYGPLRRRTPNRHCSTQNQKHSITDRNDHLPTDANDHLIAGLSRKYSENKDYLRDLAQTAISLVTLSRAREPDLCSTRSIKTMFSTREITKEDQDLEHQFHPGASASPQHRRRATSLVLKSDLLFSFILISVIVIHREDISSVSKVSSPANPFLPLSSPHFLTLGFVSPFFSLLNLPCLAPFCSLRCLGIYSVSRCGLPFHTSISSVPPASLSLFPASPLSLGSLVRTQLCNLLAPFNYSRHPGSFLFSCSDPHANFSSKSVALGLPTYPPARFYSPCFSDTLPRIALIIPPHNAFNSYSRKAPVPNHFISRSLHPSMARNKDCFHCADLQAELEEIRAQQSILDDKQKLLDSRLEEHDKRLDE